MPLTCPVEPELTLQPLSASQNTANIEAIVNSVGGGHAHIPKGKWPVTPITITESNGRISGCGIGLSQLYIFIVPGPTASDPQHVIGTGALTGSNYIENVMITDITLDGNKTGVSWGNTGWDPNNPEQNQGNAYGIWARNCKNSVFQNVEILDCFTDGVMASIPFGISSSNPTLNCIFNNLLIRGCDRQGVSVVGGKQLVFCDITVEDIGQDQNQKPPGAGLDIEPGQGTPASREVTVANFVVTHAKQGIIVNGLGAAEQQSGIAISNVTCRNLNGTQALRISDTTDFSVDGFVCNDFNPTEPGLGIIFVDAVGTATNVAFSNVSNTPYPISVSGDKSDVNLSNLQVHECDAAVVRVGSVVAGANENTSVSLANFTFRDIYQNSGNIGSSIAVRSVGDVRFKNGLIRDSQAPREVQLFSETAEQTTTQFEGCDFGDKPQTQVFDSERLGQAVGYTNQWNRYEVTIALNMSVRYENLILVNTNNPIEVTLEQQAEWRGNWVFVKHVASGAPNITVKSGGTTIATITTEGGAVWLHRAEFSWYSNSLAP